MFYWSLVGYARFVAEFYQILFELTVVVSVWWINELDDRHVISVSSADGVEQLRSLNVPMVSVAVAYRLGAGQGDGWRGELHCEVCCEIARNQLIGHLVFDLVLSFQFC